MGFVGQFGIVVGSEGQCCSCGLFVGTILGL